MVFSFVKQMGNLDFFREYLSEHEVFGVTKYFGIAELEKNEYVKNQGCCYTLLHNENASVRVSRTHACYRAALACKNDFVFLSD